MNRGVIVIYLSLTYATLIVAVSSTMTNGFQRAAQMLLKGIQI